MRQPAARLLGAALGALLVILTASPALAGGWTQGQGKYYLKIWDRSIIGSRSYDLAGEISDATSYQDHQLNLYGEFGLIDKLTLVGFTTPVGYADVDGKSATYVGPSFLGARYGFFQDTVPTALEVHYAFAPGVGDADLAAPDALFTYRPVVPFQRIDAELQIGYPIPGGWTTASVGGRYYLSGDFDPTLTATAQAGYSTSFGLVADLHLGLVKPSEAPDINNTAGTGNTDYFGFGVGVSYWLTPRFAVNAGFDGVLYARANAATPSLTLGVELR